MAAIPGIQRLSAFDGSEDDFGARSVRLARVRDLGVPVPDGLALSFDFVEKFAQSGIIPTFDLPSEFLSIRASAGQAAWGGVPAIMNVGLTDQNLTVLEKKIGRQGALEIYRRFIKTYGVRVEGLDPEDFENLYYDQLKLSPTLDAAALETLVETSMAFYADEVGQPFPQDAGEQLVNCLRAMTRAWNKPTARILRRAKGAPEDARLGLIVQAMAFGLGDGNGAGLIQFVDQGSGQGRISGRYLPDAQGQDAVTGARTPHLATIAEREGAGQVLPSLEEIAPDALKALQQDHDKIRRALGDSFQMAFTIENGRPSVLDLAPARRSARASVRIAIDLAEDGAISREDAILRVEPQNLIESLHPQIDPNARRDVFGNGLAASPGAATGKIVFSPEAAMASHAQGETTILVRTETSPEDIRGMHAASGVLTVRGGMTSHAAVIARGLGLPCVVGASDLRLNPVEKTLKSADGRVFHEGDVVTVDGTAGHALNGAPRTIQPELTGAYTVLMNWADEVRSIGVRANADTPSDAQVARDFNVDGIGLCRTEHMFFEGDRITAMREVILAEDETSRKAALDRLLPMQRENFSELFRIMEGMPVTIRLLDPPLHEFLPHSKDEMGLVAKAMDIPVEQVIARAEDLREFNPMLGKRGVRLGITMPEIYDMQIRAIFEAIVEIARSGGDLVTPEIMIPLVSANREAELVKLRVDQIATEIRDSSGCNFAYKIGVMIETPRGALRAGDLARSSAFLSFGTNDLTQMTYGLSRDDAGRFMRDYVNLGVFAEDPFHTLDLEGVGELVLLAARRAREVNPDITLGLCGEHGGDPASIRFCKIADFDYVSCSPYRVPIARLAAAQASLLSQRAKSETRAAAE